MGADPRFYRRSERLTAEQVAGQFHLELTGDPASWVDDVGAADKALPGELVFVNAARLSDALMTRPGLIIGPRLPAPLTSLAAGVAYIAHPNPKSAFRQVAAQLVRPQSGEQKQAVSPEAVIAPDARLGPGVVIGAGAEIGAGVQIEANAVIREGVVIGAGSRIGATAVIGFSIIGERCRIGPGAIIGESGFGVMAGDEGLADLPHFGRVVIGNGVRIGANCTIDRGVFGDTVLSDRVHLDNLCHIAHNVEVGEDTLMAAFAGVSGSVKIGRGVQFGGRVGVVQHVDIGDGVRLAASAAASKDVPAGETWAGIPAQPIQKWLRELAFIRKQVDKKPARVDGKKHPGQDSTER